jgi:putative ABC transport system permease protein
MLAYYFKLATNSLRRNPILSSLMVLALGLGIGACMTTLTVYYLMSGNPIPHKSEILYAVQLDSWDPNGEPTEGPEDLDQQITYTDAMNLIKADTPARHQVAMHRSGMVVIPQDPNDAPYRAEVRATYGSFFNMFDPPFLYGTGWSRAEDDNLARVAVISEATNQKLFGGADSVGQNLYLDDQVFKVIGVLKEWIVVPKYYDITNRSFSDTAEIFIPFTISPELELPRNGNTNCWKPRDGDDFQAFLNSECAWIQFWAELPDADAASEYQEFLDNYAREQKTLGRFERPINNFITPVMEWLKVQRVVSRDNQVLVRLSFMFLAVCIINTIGLLLAKFMGKASDVALRRAMGASQNAIFTQNLIEVGLVGLLGGILGIGFAWLGLQGVGMLYRGYEHLVHLDSLMLVTALVLAVISSVIAGLFPVWRIARIAPAPYLKTQ